jgi:hypothetical protein
MRCCCCDKNLSDYESTLRLLSTGDFADTCLKCLKGLSIDVVGKQSLKKKFEDQPDEEDDYINEDFSDLVNMDFRPMDSEE